MVSTAKNPTPVLESLTVADVAVSLKVAQSTVRNWIEAGLLPRFSPPGTDVVRVLRSDFDRFVEEFTERVGAEEESRQQAIPSPNRDLIAEGSPRLARNREKPDGKPACRRRGRPLGSKNAKRA